MEISLSIQLITIYINISFLYTLSIDIDQSVTQIRICVLPNMLLIVIENNFQWNGKISYVQMSMHILKAVDFAYTEYYFQTYIV